MTNNQSDHSIQSEEDAWKLVRTAAGQAFGPDRKALSISAESDDLAIEVMAGGSWRADQSIPAEASRIFDIYLPYAASGKSPTVLAQVGQSLDGYIATQTGHSHYITGQEGLDHLHRLRALSDVVVVGAGTVVADDPQLTVRRVDGVSPARVVIDPRGRTPDDRKLFNDDAAPTLILTTQATCVARIWPKGVDTIVIPDNDGILSPVDIVAALSKRGFKRILIEGGGVTISGFLQAGVLDRLHVCVAPLIIGSGRPAVNLPPITHLDDALRPPCMHHAMGSDMLFDLDLE